MLEDISQLPSHSRVPEPPLLFHPTRGDYWHIHPLKGLREFGPYSDSLLGHVINPIRIASLAPNGESRIVDGLLAELALTHRPAERLSYLVDFPGFNRIFRGDVVKVQHGAFELPANINQELDDAEKPHLVLAEKISQALRGLMQMRNEFDVLVIYLPNRWQNAFVGADDEDFDLHDYIKALTASAGIPTQIVREDRALLYRCRCSVMWRLAIALYCKAGGVPWKLANADEDAAYIGISYALNFNSQTGKRFITCCSQVFDSDGAGMEFIAVDANDVHVEQDNPFLSRADMRRVMARSAALYQKRHGGRSPKQIIVHKSTQFKPEEVNGCFDALENVGRVKLIQVQQDSRWHGVHVDPPRQANQRGAPGGYPVLRGSYLPLSGVDCLVWTQGNSPEVAGGRDFYKEGKSIPSPLMLSRFAGHGGWDEDCRHVLALTKMNWNNDGLYDRLPVTLAYSSVLARTMKRMPQINVRPYQFRFFM